MEPVKSPGLSPTALCVKAVLADVPGRWYVRDDPHSLRVLIDDGWVAWVIKMSGSYLNYSPGLPDEAVRELQVAFGFEHSPERGLRHRDWRSANLPVCTEQPLPPSAAPDGEPLDMEKINDAG